MVCPTCNGSLKCPSCRGLGKIRRKDAPPPRMITQKFATGALNPDGSDPGVPFVEITTPDYGPIDDEVLEKHYETCSLCKGTGKCYACAK